jgi:rhamnogalacturonyl hydrolase YesR
VTRASREPATVSSVFVIVLAFATACTTPPGTSSTPPTIPATPTVAQGPVPMPQLVDVVGSMRRAASYYRGSYAVSTGVRNGWSWSTYVDGVHRLFRTTGDPDDLDHAMAWGRDNSWAISTREEEANELKAAQTYADLHAIDPAASLTSANARMRADLTLPDASYTWNDALFMAMPSWARWAERTGDDAYLDTMDRLYRWTRDDGIAAELPCAGKPAGLYDPAERLWYRDCRFIGERDGGEKIFWGRGNGWSAAAMAETLEHLPPDDARARPYVTMLRDMALRVRELQGGDGMWRTSMLNAADYPVPEASATGLFTYALASGVELGVLDRDTYVPVVMRAWAGLTGTALQPSGFVSHCQNVGDRPGTPYTGTGPRTPASPASPGTLHTDSPPFCVGAFLLAGSAVARLTGP